MISRHLNFLKLLEEYGKSVFLFGPRGVGKTALINQTVDQLTQRHLIFDLLRGQSYHRYVANPGLFGDEIRAELRRSSEPLIIAIDEVQKIPALLDEVHSLIEEHKKRIAFLLTGSSARKLKRGGANLLAGRAITKYLHPFSSMETDIDLSRALQFGTLPGVYFDYGHEINSLESYVAAYLQEEVQQEALVRAIDRFSRFLDFAAQLNGEPVNFAKLGKQCGVSGKTAQDYYSILMDTMLARQLPGWAHSVKKQLLQAPRFYLFDCGVLNAINGELRTELKPSSFRYGRLFENWVVQEIFRLSDYLDLGLRLHYWRDKAGHEVDLLVSRNNTQPLLAIEIKSSPAPDLADCSGFENFAADYPNVPKWCLCTSPLAYERSGVKFLPWLEGLKELAKFFA